MAARLKSLQKYMQVTGCRLSLPRGNRGRVEGFRDGTVCLQTLPKLDTT